MIQKRTNTLIHILLLLTALAISIHPIMDTDILYMLPTGDYILNNKIPDINPFITTNNMHIVIQNWLYCVILSIINNTAKMPGLYLFFVTQVYIYLTLLYKLIRPKNDPLMALIMTVLSGYTISYFNLRPEILTTTLILAQLWTLDKYRSSQNVKYLYTWPFIMLLEINMHASYWVMHYIILLPYIVPMLKTKWIKNNNLNRRELKYISIAILSTIPALFVNPYKTKMITYVFQALCSKEFKEVLPYIAEQGEGFKNIIVFIILMISMILLTLTIYQKKLTSTSLYMYMGLFILTCSAIKWVSLLPIGCAYISKDFITNKTIPEQKILNDKKEYKKTLFVLSSLAIMCVMIATKTQTFLSKGYQQLGSYVDYIQEQDPNAYVYTTFAKNNYLMYRGLRVHHDARPELYTQALYCLPVFQIRRT